MSNVVSLTAVRAAKLEAELRQKFNIEPGQTSRPIGFIVSQIIADCRLKMAERRNKGEVL